MDAANQERARHALLAWYDRHRRDLPWRRTRDPYAIWVSEIMLQQTRVAAVLEHYARWMLRFPSVQALARAEEPEVLAHWSGLGYYRRARYLHAAAQVVVAEHASRLPSTAAGLRSLPGIGEYTSAAIASIGAGEPVAVVDGNVERVLTRLEGFAAPGASGASARAMRERAQALLDHARPGDWNQAMMELGATVCLPRAPLCLQCPLIAWCATRGEHPAAPKKKMTSRSAVFALVTRAGASSPEVLLRQRPKKASLMAGMWELPEQAPGADGDELLALKHSITVTNYRVSVIAVSADQLGDAGGRWFPVEQFPEIALTGLARKILRRLGLWPGLAAFIG